MTETARDAAKRLFAKELAEGFKVAAGHRYCDAGGSLLFLKVRLKHPDGRKHIKPIHLNGSGWQFGEAGCPAGSKKPLYRLPELLAQPGADAWVVEGEQKADALSRLGLLATTSGGSSSASSTDWSSLAGRSVAVWPDHDRAGQRYADEVAAILRGIGCTVRRVDVAKLGLPPKGDAVDWLAAHPEATADDVRALPVVEAAEGVEPDEHRNESELVLLSGESIEPEPISWLWRGWLAAAKLHILAGAPGTGKTTLALALAATVTTGGRWPDGSRTSPGSVLVASFEDDPTDTLAPRLIAMGADMARIKFLSAVREGDRLRSLHAGEHGSLLAEAIRQHDVLLVVVDPIISALGSFDSHRNAETRQALQPLADAAAGTKAAVLGIAHFSKGTAGRDPLERVSGSLAFGALARVVLGAARVKTEGEERRMFLRVKSNIGPDDGGFEYVLQQDELTEHRGVFASRVLWGDSLEGSARELLAEADAVDDDGEGGALADAKRFLAGLLADGPVPTKLIKADADGAGYSWATIRRAQSALGVVATKAGMKEGWKWSLPEDAQENAKTLNKKSWASSADNEHLRRNHPCETDIVEGEL